MNSSKKGSNKQSNGSGNTANTSKTSKNSKEAVSDRKKLKVLKTALRDERLAKEEQTIELNAVKIRNQEPERNGKMLRSPSFPPACLRASKCVGVGPAHPCSGELDLDVKFLGLTRCHPMNPDFILRRVRWPHPRLDAVVGGIIILGPSDHS